MARSPIKTASESDVTSAAEETLDFDDDTLRAKAEGYKNEGNDHYRKKDFYNAIYFYTGGIKVNCKDKELKAKLYSNRATAHFYLGNYKDSLSDAKVATDIQPRYVKAIVRGASASVELNQFEEAITWCDKGLAFDKNNKTLLELRSMSTKEQNKLQDTAFMARSPVKDAIEYDFTSSAEETLDFDDDTLRAIAEGYKNEGNDHYKNKDFSNAIYFYTEGIKVNCKDEELKAKLYNNRATAHFYLGNYKDSLSDANIATDLQPSYVNAIVRGASACAKLNRFQEAITWCDEGLAIDESNKKLLELRSRSAKEQNKLHDTVRKKAKDQEETQMKNYISLHKTGSDVQDSTVKTDTSENLGNIIREFEKIIDYLPERGDRGTQGMAYLGTLYHSLGDFKKAVDYHERHLKTAKEVGDRSGEGMAYSNLGIAYDSLGDFKKAVDYHEQHLKIAKEVGDKSGEGTAYGNLGNAYHSLGDFKKAIDYNESCLKIAKEVGDRSGEGKAYGALGNAYFSLGDFKKAIDYHECHTKIAREVGDRSGEGIASGNLGNAYRSLGDFKKAIDYHERHLKIAKEVGDRLGEGKAYGNLGNTYNSLGNLKKAINYTERCRKIAKEVGDRSGEGTAYANLGNAYYSLGDFKKAIDYHECHLKIAKEVEARSREGMAYGSLGSAYHSLGDFKKAISYHEHYLEIAKEVGTRSGEGGAYGNLGNAYYSLGEFKKAIDYHESCLKIAKEVGDRSGEGTAYGNLGSAYYSLGDFKRAIDFHERHLKIAREVGDRSGEGKTYGNLGNAYHSLGDFKIARDHYESGLKVAKEVGNDVDIANSFHNLGNHLKSLGVFQGALDCFIHSVAKFNEVRRRLEFDDHYKISLRNVHQRAYVSLWRLLVKQGKVLEGLFSAEQARAQALKDLMELKYSPAKDQVGSGTEIATIRDILSFFPSNTVFIAIGEQEVIVWTCQKGHDVQLRRKQISNDNDAYTFLQSLMEATCQEIGTRSGIKCEDRSLDMVRDENLAYERSPPDEKHNQSLIFKKGALSTWYDTIIEPLQDLLLDGELVFVPEGPVCLAPFAAFMDSNSKYLCESFKTRVIPSLTSLKLIAECPADYHSNTGALLVGDPWVQDVTYQEVRLQQLPFARKEVQMIGEILHTVPLIGTGATKGEVLKQISSVALVHIAAHGRMETGEIALAPNPAPASGIPGEEDFILTMTDVLNVQIRARLVVLSCCHSARGEINAEGVVGIARAFLGAGAQSVLVSLWAIDDEATLEFMKVFYLHLVKGRSASESLNQAMKYMRESDQFSAVKYWAPFVLIGDDVTLEFGERKQ